MFKWFQYDSLTASPPFCLSFLLLLYMLTLLAALSKPQLSMRGSAASNAPRCGHQEAVLRSITKLACETLVMQEWWWQQAGGGAA